MSIIVAVRHHKLITAVPVIDGDPVSFRVEVGANESDEHPKVFTDFHIKYIVSDEVPEAQLEKAIKLSQERYCGVTAMFKCFAPVTHEVVRVN